MAARDQYERLRHSVEIGMREDDVRDLRDAERRLKLAEDRAALAQRPGILELIRWAKSDINSVNERLSTDRALLKDGREAERLAMLERKDVLSYLLVLFDPSAELEALEQEFSKSAEQFEEYHGTGAP